MKRTVIVGGPRTGKTTLAETLGAPVIHTDTHITVGNFSAQSDAAVRHFDIPGDWTLEGVTAVRALRKWLESHPEGKPCDTVIHLARPHVSLTGGQATLGKGCETVWREIELELRKRGVSIDRR